MSWLDFAIGVFALIGFLSVVVTLAVFLWALWIWLATDDDTGDEHSDFTRREG